jgi:hypothetical protein
MVGDGNERAAAFALPRAAGRGRVRRPLHAQLGVAYVVLDGDPTTPDGLLAALPSAELVTGRATYFVRAVTPVAKVVQWARGRGRRAPTGGTKMLP